jgi:hypothetical protein
LLSIRGGGGVKQVDVSWYLENEDYLLQTIQSIPDLLLKRTHKGRKTSFIKTQSQLAGFSLNLDLHGEEMPTCNGIRKLWTKCCTVSRCSLSYI